MYYVSSQTCPNESSFIKRSQSPHILLIVLQDAEIDADVIDVQAEYEKRKVEREALQQAAEVESEQTAQVAAQEVTEQADSHTVSQAITTAADQVQTTTHRLTTIMP